MNDEVNVKVKDAFQVAEGYLKKKKCSKIQGKAGQPIAKRICFFKRKTKIVDIYLKTSYP
ncbi:MULTISPECIES: hypothetical protein [Bacillus]|uniref:hypothetical protein n=1 Tax=Bacillus TaxID=1386 RepID=UPI001E3065A9|nr:MULTISPECIES: hypothetical protein [Bacillus]MCC9090001.1 hypothetical protein [Bacillus pumilus]MED1748596.1 hypothetical protein [Bacillus zhangzhouensis]UUD42748.1 hypothetical protein NPA43_18515 [Bacillus pumilus]